MQSGPGSRGLPSLGPRRSAGDRPGKPPRTRPTPRLPRSARCLTRPPNRPAPNLRSSSSASRFAVAWPASPSRRPPPRALRSRPRAPPLRPRRRAARAPPCAVTSTARSRSHLPRTSWNCAGRTGGRSPAGAGPTVTPANSPLPSAIATVGAGGMIPGRLASSRGYAAPLPTNTLALPTPRGRGSHLVPPGSEGGGGVTSRTSRSPLESYGTSEPSGAGARGVKAGVHHDATDKRAGANLWLQRNTGNLPHPPGPYTLILPHAIEGDVWSAPIWNSSYWADVRIPRGHFPGTPVLAAPPEWCLPVAPMRPSSHRGPESGPERAPVLICDALGRPPAATGRDRFGQALSPIPKGDRWDPRPEPPRRGGVHGPESGPERRDWLHHRYGVAA